MGGGEEGGGGTAGRGGSGGSGGVHLGSRQGHRRRGQGASGAQEVDESVGSTPCYS